VHLSKQTKLLLAALSSAVAFLVACGSGSVVDPSNTDPSNQSFMDLLQSKDSVLNMSGTKLDSLVSYCKSNPSLCSGGNTPTIPSSSSVSEVSSSGTAPETSSSSDAGTSSATQQSSSSTPILNSSSSTLSSSSAKVSSSSAKVSSSSAKASSSSAATPSSSSAAQSGSTVTLAPNEPSKPLEAGTYTVNHTCTQKMAFKCSDGSCEITVGTESVSPGWYEAISVPASGVSVSSAESFEISCY